MKLEDILNPRRWPHPQYGNYGGAQTRCKSNEEFERTGVCPVPKDGIDKAFAIHDEETGDDKEIFADPKLVGRLLQVNPLGKYDRPVYGRLYHAGALLTFTVLSLFTVPVRSVKYVSKQL
jgi:hypothetical protein